VKPIFCEDEDGLEQAEEEEKIVRMKKLS